MKKAIKKRAVGNDERRTGRVTELAGRGTGIRAFEPEERQRLGLIAIESGEKANSGTWGRQEEKA